MLAGGLLYAGALLRYSAKEKSGEEARFGEKAGRLTIANTAKS